VLKIYFPSYVLRNLCETLCVLCVKISLVLSLPNCKQSR